MTKRREILTHKIDGIAWSFGYIWQSPTSNKTLRRDAESEAAVANADAVALRPDVTHAQYGLGTLEPNDRTKGMVAAAAFATELAKLTIRSAIGLFAVASGYWVVVLRNDLIDSAHGDCFYSDLDEALTAFKDRLIPAKQLHNVHHWDKIYLPMSVLTTTRKRLDKSLAPLSPFESFIKANITNVSTQPLAEFLRTVKAPTHRQINKVRKADILAYVRAPLAKAGYTALGLAALGWGGMELYDHLIYVPPPAAPKKQFAQPPAPPPVAINTAVPSGLQPPVSSFLNACFDRMAELDDATPPGWEDMLLTCHPGGANATIARSGGTIAKINVAYHDAAIAFNSDYDQATITRPAVQLQQRRPESLAQSEVLRRRLITIGWTTAEKITVEKFQPPATRAYDDRATWKQANFAITSGTDIGEWGALLDQIPGVAITLVTADSKLMKSEPKTFKWEIRGVLYAQP